MTDSPTKRWGFGILVVTLALGMIPALGAGADRQRPTCDPENGDIALPDGFCATVFADDLVRARHIVVTNDGAVYVAINNAPDGSAVGGVVGLRDNDNDGHADEEVRFGVDGGNGVALHNRHLYFAMNDSIARFPLTAGQLNPSGPSELVVSGLPADGDHVSKTVVIAGNGRLFVNIGSASNSCQVENRVLMSPGIDPCPELPVRAGVWAFSARELGQTQEDGIRYATGLRNMVALALHPTSAALWGAQNGRDQLFENWPNLYTFEDDLVLPSEELFQIERGGDYGWPYCYYDPFLAAKVLAPEYGGDGETQGRCADKLGPEEVFPAHWAPLSMVFGEGLAFPPQFRRGAFIAFHGSRFEPNLQPDGPGYNVVFVPFSRNGSPSGGWSVFADGFADDLSNLPESAEHRPVGLAVGPDGALYVSDDVGGRIWKIQYTGR